MTKIRSGALFCIKIAGAAALLAVFNAVCAVSIHAEDPVNRTSGAATQKSVANLKLLSGESSAFMSPNEQTALHAPMPVPDQEVPGGNSTLYIVPSAASSSSAPPASASSLSPSPAANFLALGDNNTVIPPDTHGAAGPNHLMVTLNSQVRIQNRSGVVISTVSLNSFWSSLGSPGVFDPKVLYDPFSNRWMFTACANSRSASSALLMGVSQTSDPTGAWNLYKIDGDPADLVWVDYPSMGFNKDWIVVQVNMFNVSGSAFNRSHIYVFNKADLYAGGSGLYTMFSSSSIGGTQVPSITYDNTVSTIYLVNNWNGSSGGSGFLRLFSITGPVGAESFNQGNLLGISSPWGFQGAGGADFAPQLGSANKIQTNDSRIQNMVYRNGSLWLTQNVFLPDSSPTRSSIQWMQITPNITSSSVQQFGRIDDPSGANFYAYPSIAVNKNNDVLIGYSKFSSTQYASGNYSFRYSTDPANTLQSDYTLKAGEASYYKVFSGTRNRWGDYSSTVVDPVDDLNFWTIQEYASTGNLWSTWWGHVSLGIAPTVTLTSPANGSTYNSPANIVISADASDTDGTISEVSFYRNNILIATDTSSPYQVTWSNVGGGEYNLTARATDSQGIVGTSSASIVKVTLTPPKPANLKLWLKADGISGLSDGAAVSNWADISGNGSNAGQATGSRQPVYRTSQINGKPAVRFDGVDDYLDLGAVRWNLNGYTILIVNKVSGQKANNGFMSFDDDASSVGNNTTFELHTYDGNTATTSHGMSVVSNRADAAKFAYSFKTEYLALNSYQVLGARWSGPGAKVGLYANGAVQSAVDADNVHNFAPVAKKINIGLGYDGAAAYLSGDIAEILVYDVALSDAERSEVEQYLAGKYALSGINAVPAVSISSPANGATYAGPVANIAMAASATDSDGSISQVEFFSGTTSLGVDLSSPYQTTWTGVGGGAYSLKAVGTDNRGGAGTSGTVNVTVSAGNNSPSVSLTAPANGATYNIPATVELGATASDSDGSIAQVEFFAGSTSLGSDLSSPYGLTWSNVGSGAYSLKARATDNHSASTDSELILINVYASQPPQVTLDAPPDGFMYTAPANVSLIASAYDPDGSINVVEFFQGSTLIASDNVAGYSATWSSVAAGSYTLTAKATDNTGGVVTTPGKQITVHASSGTPIVNMSQPPEWAAVTAPADLEVRATASDSDGTISMVELFEGTTLLLADTTNPYSMTWTGVAAGTYNFTAKATDNSGLTRTTAGRRLVVKPPQATWTVRYSSIGNNDEGANFAEVDSAGNVLVLGTKYSVPVIHELAKYGPAGNELWRITCPGTPSDLKIDAMNNIYVCGYLYNATQDAYLTKYNSNGVQQWSRNYNGPGNAEDSAASIGFDGAGNIYVGGSATGVGTQADFLVLKYDTNGTELWARLHNGSLSLDDYVSDIAVDAAGNVHLAGGSFPEAVFPEIGDCSIMTAKYDTNGNFQWANTYQGTGNAEDIAETIGVDQTGSVYVAGSTVKAGGTVDIILIKYTSAGSQSWIQFYDGIAGLNDYVYDMDTLVLDSGGNIILSGYTQGTANPTSDFDVITLKYNQSGSLVWSHKYAGAGIEWPKDIALDSSDNIYVTGTSSGQGVFGRDQITTFKLNNAGNQQWVYLYDGPSDRNDEADAIAVDMAGNVYVAGTLRSIATGGDWVVLKYGSGNPLVHIVAPAPNSIFTNPSQITVSAAATDLEGSVSDVSFYAGGTLLGTDSASPYEFSWINPSPGTYQLRARAMDNANNISFSVTVPVTVNAAPVVSLTSPADNESFYEPVDVLVSATASDVEGALNRVEFFQGSTSIAVDSTSPFTVNWTSVAPGTYLLSATAFDSNGAMTASSSVSITVVGNAPPSIGITAPVNGSIVHQPSVVAIHADAQDAGDPRGSYVTKVDFYEGATLIHTDTAAPWGFTWTSVAAGSYELTARATDNGGAENSSPNVNITVTSNFVPTASITSPVDGAVFAAPASINIAANAADSDGSITQVELFNGSTSLGTDVSSPYSFNWNAVAAGIYNLSVVATDNAGATTTSSTISITVNQPPTVSLTLPVDGTLYATGNIPLSATASDSDGSITQVAFYAGSAHLGTDPGSPYAITWNSVAIGTYSITAQATDNRSTTTTSSAAEIEVVSADEYEFRQRAELLTTQVADVFTPPGENSNPKYNGVPDPEKYVWPKVIARYLKYPGDTWANDRIGYLANRAPFHFTFVGMARIISLYPDEMGMITNRTSVLNAVWNRTDSYNAWTAEGTENHINMSRTSGYIYAAESLGNPSYPDATARQADMKNWIMYWSKKIYEVGTGEWDSGIYTTYNLIGWLNLYDFSTDPEIQDAAKAVLDFYATSMALKYTQGVTSGSEMRGNGTMTTASNATDYLNWLWFGDILGTISFSGNDYIQCMHAVTSSYRPPDIAIKLARKQLTVPATYQNSKPSYLLNRASDTREVFHIGPSYTLGTSFSPNGGWTGGDNQIVNWKLVARLANTGGTSPFVVTGNGGYRTSSGHQDDDRRGLSRTPWDQFVQHKNVLLQMTRVPTNASSIDSQMTTLLNNWLTSWQTDFDLRFPTDTARTMGGFKSSGNNANMNCYISYPSAVTTVSSSNIRFLELGTTYVAIRSLAGTAPTTPLSAGGGRNYVRDTTSTAGNICGLVMEVGNSTDHGTFSNFQSLIIAKNGLNKSNLASQKRVIYTSLSNDVIDVTYTDSGTFTEPDFDWDYGATTPQVIITSPPFIQPTWPSGPGHARIASWSVNSTAVDLTSAWPVYNGPNLLVNGGILQLTDGTNTYQVDYSGSLPVFTSTP